MADPKSNQKLKDANSRRREKELKTKNGEQSRNYRAKLKDQRFMMKAGALGGVALGMGVAMGVAELNRKAPGFKPATGTEKEKAGFARLISYVVALAGGAVAGVSDGPLGLGAAVTLGTAGTSQQAIDSFVKGRTDFTKDVKVTITRPAPK